MSDGDLERALAAMDEESRARIGIDAIVIEAGALKKAAGYAAEKGYRRLVAAVDAHTYEAAGRELAKQLEQHGLKLEVKAITANGAGDIIADEASIVELLLAIQRCQAEAVFAVGGGTIHDIVRYAAYTSGIPFLSIPTAPSVDGFNSKGAPIIVRGYKKTILSIGPNAVFADLDVLSRAPAPLTAAGFGDILGKYTSLFDWKFGALTHSEPYSAEAEQITSCALKKCVRQVELIAKRDEEGIAALMSGLLESGLAMLLFGQSHPASGAEHHLSHYWEMEYIQQGRRQLLHGAKVGVACIEISSLYHRLSNEQFGSQRHAPEQVAAHWNQIQALIATIPEAEQLRELLTIAGGPTSAAQLGISQELLDRSLREAHLIRPERYTLLHTRNASLAHEEGD